MNWLSYLINRLDSWKTPASSPAPGSLPPKAPSDAPVVSPEQGGWTQEGDVRRASRPAATTASAPPTPTAPDVGVLGRFQAQLGKTFQWPGVGSGDEAGWAIQDLKTPSPDVTNQFKADYGVALKGQLPLPADANRYQYLMVGGLFTDSYPGYFKQNVEGLQKWGIQDVSRVPVDTGASSSENAQKIRDAVLNAAKSGKQVVLIGQSKGAVDITEAVALYPEIRKSIRAVVSMQGPYGGTPIASDLIDGEDQSRALESVLNGVIEDVFHGVPASLSDLTYAARKAFVSAHPYPADQVPTLSLATGRALADGKCDPKSALFLTTDYLHQRYGLQSDGLVPTKDAIIPGSSLVTLTDMDHADGVLTGIANDIGPIKHFQNYQPAALTQALVKVALEDVPSPTAAGATR
jgi:triacylglycerol lipase